MAVITKHRVVGMFICYAKKPAKADFPHHQIELHLDIAGADPQRLPPWRRRRLNYIKLRKPEYSTVGSNRINLTETTQLSKAHISSTTDPDMQPVYVKDLKKAIEDLERKYNARKNGPVDAHQNVNTDINMKEILQLLEKGTLVGRDVPKPADENMNWLQIKIPKNK